MATDSVTVSPTFNGDSVALTAGMIVRLKAGANNNVVRAQADSSAHVQGTCGVVVSGSCASGSPVLVAAVGRRPVQMESGLTLGVSDTVYVSASVAGKGTNVIPGVVLPIGSIADISAYARNGTVEVDVVAAASEAGAGGTFPGFGGAPPAVAATSDAGAAGTASRSDHTHAGVTSLNSEQGALTLESLGGTVSITTPDETHVNLEVATPFSGLGAAPPIIVNSLSTAGAATTASRSDHDHGQNMVAQWPIANPRIYAVDGVGGDDANLGFADAVSASSADVAAATVSAGLVAKKTLAALTTVFPTVGAGRLCAIVIAAGTYADSLASFFNGVSGYKQGPVVRGTSTNATAGAVAFSGTPQDLIFVGAVTGTGMHAAGYNPTAGATTTSVPCQLAGGGAAGFAAPPAKPLGLRIRFDSATATVALRNVCAAIVNVIGGNTLTLANGTLLPAVPGLTDVFYIEQPGVVIPGSSLTASGLDSFNAGLYSGGPFLVGLHINGSFGPIGVFNTAFLEFGSLNIGIGRPGALESFQELYIYVDSSFNNVGSNFRCDGGFVSDFTGNTLKIEAACIIDPTTVSLLDIQQVAPIDGCSFSPQVLLGGNAPSISFDGVTFGGETNLGNKPCNIFGNGAASALVLRRFNGVIQGVGVQGAGAHPAIAVQGDCFFQIDNTLTGTTGNTDVGLDLTGAQNCIIVLTSQPTVTGVAGDVRLSSGIIVSWASLFATGLVDTKGNRFVSTFGPVVPIKCFSGVIITSAGGATFGYLADTGTESTTPTANQTDPIGYPTSLRLITRLRGAQRTGTGAQPPTFTLYKNGVATAQTVTLPASTGGPVQVADLAHPILFADGDLFDVRCDFALTAEGNQPVTATLEGPC